MADQEKLTILIVDDDRIVSLLHKSVLKRNDIKNPPVVCTNGKEAVDYLAKNRNENASFLVLLDLNMPVMNGWGFLREVEKISFRNELFVIVVTSSVNKADYIKSQKFENVIGFYKKPFDTHAVQELKSLKETRKFFVGP